MTSLPKQDAFPVSSKIGEALPLLGQVMRPENPAQLAAEFPLVFGKRSRGGARALLIDGKPVSGAAFCAFDAVTVPPVALKIGAIGSVSTHPDFRGKGLASITLTECEKALRDEGCQFSLLWSQIPNLYVRNGYHEVGTEMDFVVTPMNVEGTEPVGGIVLPYDEQKDFEDCFDLYCSQPLRVRRTAEEFRDLLKVPGMETYVYHVRGKGLGYAIFGKGADFQGAIHEWGGEPMGIKAILQSLFVKKRPVPECVVVISSSERKDLVEAMKEWKVDPIFGVLGMIKVLNAKGFLKVLNPFLQEAYGLEASVSESGYSLSGERESMHFEEKDFLRLVFGYRGISGEAYAAAKRLAVPSLKEKVPVPMFFWGLDSI